MKTTQDKGKTNYILGLKLIGISALALFLLQIYTSYGYRFISNFSQAKVYKIQPLVMEGGDPYIRALMRTISASESNVIKPYNVIYGGRYVVNLNSHPNKCVTIMLGPNRGKCSTAAGRYQFLNNTWYEKAEQYYPKTNKFLWRKNYSFEPQYQDQVVYKWLNDHHAWGVDISHLLRHGKIEQVLKILSGTWTSLGYGIETNSMSKYLPQIYQQMLKEELKS